MEHTHPDVLAPTIGHWHQREFPSKVQLCGVGVGGKVLILSGLSSGSYLP